MISHIAISAKQISRRVDALAQGISCLYEGKELAILAVMTGSLVFLADLIRRLPLVTRISLISVSSYAGAATSSKGIVSIGEIPSDLAGRDVLILDDILDTGQTLQALSDRIWLVGPKSVKICVLLRKIRPGWQRPEADFVGFEIADEFVVGYGLDYNNMYRNLPDVCVLKIAPPGEAS